MRVIVAEEIDKERILEAILRNVKTADMVQEIVFYLNSIAKNVVTGEEAVEAMRKQYHSADEYKDTETMAAVNRQIYNDIQVVKELGNG